MMVIVLGHEIRPIDETQRPTEAGMYGRRRDLGVGQSAHLLDQWITMRTESRDDRLDGYTIMIGLPRQPIPGISGRETLGAGQEFFQTDIVERVKVIQMAEMPFG